MAKQKRNYNVYIRQVVDDYTGDPDLAIKYEDFIGTSWAVSAAQAANNVRFRRGERFNFAVTEHSKAYYYAIPVDEDYEDLHAGFYSWDRTH